MILRNESLKKIFCGIKNIIVILFLIDFISIDLVSQQFPDSTKSSEIIQNTIVSVNRPGDIIEEWWLYLKTGKTIYCNRTDITSAADELKISGTLRDIAVPKSEVTAILMKPAPNSFRDGFVLGTYLFGALFLSPVNTPGYFIGTGEDFPSVQPWGLLLTALAGAAAGAINSSGTTRSEMLSLDGTESDKVWKRILETREPRLHFRGFIGFVHADAKNQWKQYYKMNGIEKSSGKALEQDLTNINILRFMSVTFTLSKKFEAGFGIHTGGEAEFNRLYEYYSSGNPPQLSTISLGGEYSTTGYYVVLNYINSIMEDESLKLRVGCAFGTGISKITDRETFYSNFNPRIDETINGFTFVLDAGLDYYFDPHFSIGVNGDYASFGNASLPAQIYKDYSGNIRLMLPGATLNLNSYAIGITFGVHN